MSKVLTIGQSNQPKTVYQIPVLIGAPEELVTHRKLVNKYETNGDIKTWSCWFLLKALTTSGLIKNWYKQKDSLLPWLQLNEKTFRRRLEEMQLLQLITMDDDGSLTLISYEKAAGILDIPFCGTYAVEYNPDKYAGKQTFQYFLRGEEVRLRQEIQLDGLTYHLDQNPLLKNKFVMWMVKAGADGQRLYKDARYFQQRLLKLQMQLFKEGSELLEECFQHRADINRGVQSIQKAHCYKATTSVSYMKKRMAELGLIKIDKVCVRSKDRSRLYVPDGKGGKRDGYKWIAFRKETALFLTDQISFTYESKANKKGERKASNAA